MKINFKDKSMEFDAPLSVFDAASAAELVTRAHIAAHVNGKLVSMTTLLDGDADVELLTFEDADGKLVWKCPVCGNTDQATMNVARRTCGYIGTQYWNQGRTQEIKERVLHL